MLDFLLIIVFLITFIILALNSNIFFNYIRIKIKVIGLDIEIISKEKSAPSCKDKRQILEIFFIYNLIAPKQNKCSKDTQCWQH